MADSNLVTVEKFTSTKCKKNRVDSNGVKHTVDTITIHCTAGNKHTSAEATVDYWTNNGIDASAQYVVGGDGSVCQNVFESDRAWTTGGMTASQMKKLGRNYETGSMNDYHSITIEVASNIEGTEVTDEALNKTIDLVTDICKRHGKTKAIWFGDDAEKMVNYVPASYEMKFTWHRWFAQKSCPGQYIMNHMQYIIDTVNARLSAQNNPKPNPTPATQPITNNFYRLRLSWEDVKSQIGAYKVYDNAIAACKKHAGYSVYDSNGNCVYSSVVRKSDESIAKEVIQGKWGNGVDRKNRLTKAGYDYNKVQSIVDHMLNNSHTPKKSYEEIAREVIQGKWGNGTNRKNNLVKAGYDYNKVQTIVNRMLR